MRNFERAKQRAREEAIKDTNKRIDEIVLDLLTDIEMEQEIINGRLTRLYTMMGQYPMFEKRWQEFQKQGGVTADDYYNFLRNRFAPRKIVKRKHLRLVSTNTPQKSKSLPRHRLHPNDAA
jgi:hypothetical protein